MTNAGLFSGIGGWALGASWCKIPSIFEVEINDYCQKVLKKRFPHTYLFNDVQRFSGQDFQNKVDILTGSFPCQDVSVAGKNIYVCLAGKRTGLFWQLIRIANEVKPKYVFWENNPPILKEIDKIHLAFKEIGYVSSFKQISNRAFGFPHLRERIYGVAITNTDGVGWHKVWYFHQELEKIIQSEKIKQRQNNQKQFIRTFGLSLRSKTNRYFYRDDDGIPDKFYKDRITALGNSVNPFVTKMFYEAAIITENEFKGRK